MLLSADVKELLELFKIHEVEHALVGGLAVSHYGYVRVTQDVDLLVRPSKENAARVMRSLTDFGFGGAGIPQSCFEQRGIAVHLGAEPNRIDLLTSIEGVDTAAIFSAARTIELQGVRIKVISLDHLIMAKQSSTRSRDHADAEELVKIRSRLP